MAEVERLAVLVEANTAQMERAMKRLERITDTSFKRQAASVASLDARIMKITGTITRMAGAFGLSTGILSIGMAAQRAVGEIGDLNDAAERSAVSAEKLQVLRFALDQTAGNAEDADAALQKFNVSIGQAASSGSGAAATAFAELGVAVKDAGGAVRDNGAIFDDVAEKIAGIADPSQKAALAAALFGKALGPEMAVLLSQGKAGVAGYEAKLRDLGGLMSNEMVAAGDQLDTKFKEWALTLDVAFKGTVIDVANAVWYLHDVFTSAAKSTNLAVLRDKLSGVTDEIAKQSQLIEDFKSGNAISIFGIESGDAQRKLDDLTAQANELNDRMLKLQQRDVLAKPNFTPTVLADPGLDKESETKAKAAKQRIDEVVKSLAFEADQIGRTDREQEIYNRLKEAGVTADSKWGEKIAEATGKLYDQQVAMDALKERISEVRDIAKDFASTFLGDLREGKSASDALADSLGHVADKLASKAIDVLINSLFATVPGRAVGGPVNAGMPYMVGERGPELFVPRMNGRIEKSGGRAGAVTNVNFTQNLSVQGSSGDARADARYLQTLRNEAKSAAREVINENMRLGGAFNPVH